MIRNLLGEIDGFPETLADGDSCSEEKWGKYGAASARSSRKWSVT